MATSSARAIARILCASCSFTTIVLATPDAAFPFNAQVPTVARTNRAYSFELSESTFTPNTENFTYSLSQQPAWLSIDSATRTLVGTPGQGDVGSSAFVLTAADSTGGASMQCTLVVSSDPAPRMSGDISQQLAATANLSSSSPPVVTLLPSTAFTFDFQQSSFIDIISRKLYYYATLTDHTPLPSWLHFDPDKLVFSGTAPELSAFPQSWSVEFIASDVEGFAGATASFTIAIGTHQLAFVPEEQEMNVTAGERMSFKTLQDQLFLNDVQLDPKELASANASVPSWLTFDSTTLAIEGSVPANFSGQNLTVYVTDKLGNTATAVIDLTPGNASFFERQIGTLVAQAGLNFEYEFQDTLFSEDDLDLVVAIPTSAPWLSFNASTKTLEGTVPSTASATTVQATLTAKPGEGDEGQSQVFTIDIKSANVSKSASSTASSTSATDSPTSSPVAGLASEKSNSHLSGGNIALTVVLTIVGAAIILACLICCLRRRKGRQNYVDSPTPSKKSISRPIPHPSDTNNDNIVVTTRLQHDVEKYADSVLDLTADRAPSPAPTREIEPPPQISVSIPTEPTNRRMKWSKRFSRISQVSSIGAGGEEALRADSNIPEWGQKSSMLNTPHDSFSVPAEIARLSRHLSTNTSPSKRALQRLRERHTRSRDSVGLGISRGIPRHSSRRVGKHRRGRSSFGGLSAPREASSMASLSTRGTSVLSTRPSEFPMPPISSHNSTSLSAPTLSLFEAHPNPNRKSIRLVEGSDSVADPRPFDQKRQSFIHNRASRGGIQSPLFAHGSSSKNNSSHGSLRRSRGGKSMLATYSESSSLEPQQSRLSQRGDSSKRLSTRVKSIFPPSFPRVVTRSTIYSNADDEEDDDWTTSSEDDDDDNEYWRAELSKPRHERSWVLPDEASPTPPPLTVPPTSRRSTPASRKFSSSPLASTARKSQLVGLVSGDSMSKRPRLAQTNSKRPVSVDEGKRLSSMKAETDAASTRAGSERWEDEMPRPPSGGFTGKSARSDLSGPAFL